MNIFQVLSQGKSRLNEPSMSAMVGYLLDSKNDHGLGDTFVREFLSFIDNKQFENILSLEYVNSEVSLEEPYQLNGQRKDIDIQLIILDEKKDEKYKIIIENKIKVGAANPKQLNEYYQAILEDEREIENLAMIFLTPCDRSTALQSEFANLILLENSKHSKHWIQWLSDEPNNSNEPALLDIIRNVLTRELQGDINPINEYMRHTLKAFIRYASLETAPKSKKLRRGEDLGEITDEIIIDTNDGNQYRVVRRDSKQIQVFNLETGDKEIARRILGQYIDENSMDINYEHINTRSIGKQFFELIEVPSPKQSV